MPHFSVQNEASAGATQGRTQGGGLGLNPPLSLIFYKNLLPA